MSLGILKLEDIVSSDYGTLLKTNNGIFVINAQDIDDKITPEISISAKNNKWNTIDFTNDITYANMYDLSQFEIQTYQYRLVPSMRTNTVNDYAYTFAPTGSYKSICQYGNYAYMMSDLFTHGPRTIEATLSNDEFVTYDKTFIDLDTMTYVLPGSAVIASDVTSGFNSAVPLYNLSGMNYNYLCEIPLSFKYFNYDVDSTSGYYSIYGDTITCKNPYDIFYSMNSRVVSTSDSSHVSASVDYCRDYENIKVTGDLIYFTFKTNKFYETTGSIDIAESGIEYGDDTIFETSAFLTSGNIAQLPIQNSTSNPNTSSVYAIYDNVEIINTIDRIRNQSGHKANLFSINIQNANINNNSALSDSEKTEIKQTLNNIIRSIWSNIAPANTQLFEIYYNGN